MAYNHLNQYRFTIIRGKAKTVVDNILPLYAQIIDNICPIGKTEFASSFNTSLQDFFPSATKKALDNHRTEIAGSLFGMFWTDVGGIVRISERAMKLILDNDQPAFFKDVCAKIQFPSGADNQYLDAVHKKIRLLPCSYVLNLMQLAESNKLYLNRDEIGYYALNNLDVLKGEVNPQIILDEVIKARKSKIERKIPLNGHASSFAYQHITELLSYLELANLIIKSNGFYILNQKEKQALNFICSLNALAKLPFDIYNYDLSSIEGRKKMELDWDQYFGKISTTDAGVLETKVSALVIDGNELNAKGHGVADSELGAEGERYVFNQELKRVKNSFPMLCNQVLLLANQKGIGYDIQSVYAEGDIPDKKMQIEVKSTKRVTQATDEFWDTVTMTRNEWVAAEQYGDTFYIYRVYFTQSGPMVFIIQNPAAKQGKHLRAQPIQYRVEFSHNAGNFLAS